MIHSIELPPITRKRLNDLLDIQIALLYYAASELLIHREECNLHLQEKVQEYRTKKGRKDAEKSEQEYLENQRRVFLQAKCQHYLEEYPRQLFQGREAEIANWIWSAKTRRDTLQLFAIAGQTDKYKQHRKIEWCDQLQEQMKAFTLGTDIVMNRLYQKGIEWQDAGATFLIQFYKDLRSDTKFRRGLFSGPDADAFGRQDFLEAFLDRNRGLYICAVCDGSGYHTISRQQVHTEVEHYLPKSVYPHLAIHPFNLVPICGQCNNIHGDKDPYEDNVQGRRRRLNDIFLPYRSNMKAIRSAAYLEIELEKVPVQEKNGMTEFTYAKIGNFKPRPDNEDAAEMEKLTTVLRDMYDIPGRWNDHGWTNKVGETLFRRVRQYLRDAEGTVQNIEMLTTMTETLDQLLYNLYDEDVGKDPFAYVMTWLLVAVLNEYFPSADEQSKSNRVPDQAILNEIETWLRYDRGTKKERAERAQDLKNFVKGAMSKFSTMRDKTDDTHKAQE